MMILFGCGRKTSATRSMRELMASAKDAYEAGDLDTALADFDKAIEAEPDGYGPYYGRAWVWFQKQDFERARADFENALERAPDFAPAWQGRAFCREALGDIEGAHEDLTRYLELAPDDRQAREMLQLLEERLPPRQ